MTASMRPGEHHARPRDPARPGRDWGLFRELARVCLRNGLWVWAIVLVATFAVPFVVQHFGGTPLSIFSTSAQGPRWYLFVMLLVVTLASLRPSVAHGMTRRSFARQVTAAGLLAAVGYGLLAGVTQSVESALFDQQGWVHASTYGLRPVPDGPWALVAVDHVVVLATFAVSGVAVGAVYLRWGGWIGTLALPLTVGPALAVPGLVAHVEPIELGNALDSLAYPLGLALALAICVALALAAQLALRGARVSPSPID